MTDAASGVDLSQIKFHVDVDRDEIFDEPGETISASVADSVAINQGWNAAVLLPAIGTNGLVNWYVTATDRASNVGVSDSEATAGQQFHKYTVDISPPAIEEVVLGQAWDATAKKTVNNVLNSVKVKWNEPIKEASIDASRFIIEGQSAKTATLVTGFTELDDMTEVTNSVWLTFEDIPTSPEKITIMPGAVSDMTDFQSELKELIPVDKLGPRLTVSTDTAITNSLLTIKVTTVETLTSDPTVTINGVTFGSAQPVDTNEWSIVVDGTTFTGSAAGDGVKNVEAAGFDAALNIARGGVGVETASYPTGAVQFHLDTVIKPPVVLPGDREIAIVPNPLITVSFAEEIGEYSGDSHAGVIIISAKLDGEDVTSGFTAESATTWSYRPAFLSNDDHIFEVIGRDDAGNTHGAIVRSFSVNAPEPTATPVPTETPTPLPTVDITPVVEAPPTEIPTDAADVAPADPESVNTPQDSSPVDAAPVPEVVDPEPVEVPVPEAVEPAAEPEDPAPEDAEPEVAPTPENSEEPAPATDDGGDSETPADDESADAASEDEEPVTEEDIAATVAAMRAEDEENSLDEGEGDGDGSLAPEPALTVFGCNVPTGGPEEAVGAVTAGADYLLAAAGLFGLIVARVRPKRRKDED